MKRARSIGARAERGRPAAAAFAIAALLLQSLASLGILPPPGQAVHFAQDHRGHGSNHRGGDRPGAPQPDAPSCPVCQALQAGGHSIEASAVLLPATDFVYGPRPAPAAIEAPAAPALARARARAPPLCV